MTSIGELDGRNTKRIGEVARMLNKAEIETTVITDPMAYIWASSCSTVRSIRSPQLPGCAADEMYRTPEVNALQDRIIDEILMVIERKGIRISEPDPRRKIKEHCRCVTTGHR
jgi:ketopantoate reductase